MPSEFVCPTCGARFPTEAALRDHASKAHPMPGAPPAQASFECKACGARFSSEAELKAHAAQAHRM